MNLYDWLWSHRRIYTHKQFADKLNVTPAYLSRVVNLKTQPSIRLAKEIQTLTGGQVKWHDLVDQYRDHIEKNRDMKTFDKNIDPRVEKEDL